MFKYVNLNPENRDVNDCVTRAISLVSGLDYFEVKEKLYLTSRLYGCDRLNRCCYRHFLEDVLKFEPVYCKGVTVEEFADDHPFGKYLVRVDGHLTCIKNQIIMDTHDPSDEICDLAWFCGR